MMGWYGGGWGMGAWAGMGLGMVVLWGVVILAVVSLVRSSSRTGHQRSLVNPPASAGTYTALGNLDDRFARGELTQDEYLAKRDTLLGR